MEPRNFEEYLGQDLVKAQLLIAINASIRLKKPLPHILFEGKPGLGKTSLAKCVANETGAKFHNYLGLNIKSKEDLLNIFKGLTDPPIVGYNDFGFPIFNMVNFIPDILFIDEIHGINREVEESMYSVMTELQFEYEISEINEFGTKNKKLVKGWVPPFTLVGATTLEGNLSQPFLRRFGLKFRLEDYSEDNLFDLILNYCKRNNISISKKGATTIAKRSRGSASNAILYTLRCRDYALCYRNDGKITEEMANKNFDLMRIDLFGLQEEDYKVLRALASSNGTIGINSLSSMLGIDRNAYERNIEPYLVRMGFINRTPRGRIISNLGLELIGGSS